MLKRLLIAGVISSAAIVSVPAAAHTSLGERIAAEIIVHSVFGDGHMHRNHSHAHQRVYQRDARYQAAIRADRLRLELAQVRQGYRQQASFERRRDARHDRHKLASLRVREARLSAQLAAIVDGDHRGPRGQAGPHANRNK